MTVKVFRRGQVCKDSTDKLWLITEMDLECEHENCWHINAVPFGHHGPVIDEGDDIELQEVNLTLVVGAVLSDWRPASAFPESVFCEDEDKLLWLTTDLDGDCDSDCDLGEDVFAVPLGHNAEPIKGRSKWLRQVKVTWRCEDK